MKPVILCLTTRDHRHMLVLVNAFYPLSGVWSQDRMEKMPLLLIPGLACTEMLWRHQTRALSDVCDIMIADHTRSETMVGIVADILVDSPEHFALAGFSMGGYIAMELMRQAPERVDRLALIGTKESQDEEAGARRRLSSIRLAESGRYDEAISQMMPLLVHADRLQDEVLIQDITRMAENMGAIAFIRQQKANLGRGLSRDTLKQINCTTLLMCGRQDQVTIASGHEAMAGLISHSRLIIIEECGHMAPMEKPEEITAEMRNWLLV